jgi:hypothetical protein
MKYQASLNVAAAAQQPKTAVPSGADAESDETFMIGTTVEDAEECQEFEAAMVRWWWWRLQHLQLSNYRHCKQRRTLHRAQLHRSC